MRAAGEQVLDDFQRGLLDLELGEFSAFAKVAEVREEIAEAEGRVDVLRVERREDDVGHGAGTVAGAVAEDGTPAC